MANYRISNTAKEDLIRIHQYGVHRFGEKQADTYFNALFNSFKRIAQNPLARVCRLHQERLQRMYLWGRFHLLQPQKDDVEIITIIKKKDLEQIRV